MICWWRTVRRKKKPLIKHARKPKVGKKKGVMFNERNGAANNPPD